VKTPPELAAAWGVSRRAAAGLAAVLAPSPPPQEAISRVAARKIERLARDFMATLLVLRSVEHS
jgi:hypothetical protein